MNKSSGPFELVDNVTLGSHKDALEQIAAFYDGPLHVATAYVNLQGLTRWRTWRRLTARTGDCC